MVDDLATEPMDRDPSGLIARALKGEERRRGKPRPSLGAPAIGALSHLFFLVGRVRDPAKIDYREKGTFILTSLLEDLASLGLPSSPKHLVAKGV